MKIFSGDYTDSQNSDLVIVTVGPAPKVGETRLDLIGHGVEIFKKIITQIVEKSPNCILLIVSNPVDILTQVAYKLSGFPKQRVIGSGTVLDTARLKFLLRRKFQLPMVYLSAMILGEHGDSQVIAWSQTSIAGITLADYLASNQQKLTKEDQDKFAFSVKNTGIEEITAGKGCTNFGIAASIKRIVKAILLNEGAILPVSVLAEGEYGIKDVFLSLPCLVGSVGITKIFEIPLSPEEFDGLQTSTALLKSLAPTSIML